MGSVAKSKNKITIKLFSHSFTSRDSGGDLFNKLEMRRDWRFTDPVIQEGGALELRCEHWMGFEVWKYELILTFGKMKVRAKIRKRIFSNLEWSDVASVEGLSLQGALIWAEEVLDKDIECREL